MKEYVNKDTTMFKNIIGYDEVKRKLGIVIDVLNNQNKYKKLGCTIPQGLLLYGSPGIGETSMVEDVVNNLNMKSYMVRKTKSDGQFMNYLKDVFNDAKKNQPAIIILDNIDKFSEIEKKVIKKNM